MFSMSLETGLFLAFLFHRCHDLPFSALTLLVGNRKDIRPIKSLLLVCWWNRDILYYYSWVLRSRPVWAFAPATVNFTVFKAQLTSALPSVMVGRHLVSKQLGVGLLVVTIWLELCTSYSSSCHHSPPPALLAPIKSEMETFWYQLTGRASDL